MQADPPRPEGADLPPSSPTLSSALHRHHPPETRDRHRDPSPSSYTLRHRPPFSTRPSAASSSDDSLRLFIATPFSDHARSSADERASILARKEWSAAHLKDRLAAGEGTGEMWEREGMRLVWQGRIIRDEEQLGEAVITREGQSQTVHLVARRIPSGSTCAIQRPTAASIHPPPLAGAESITASTPEQRSTAQPSTDHFDLLVLSDIAHYLLFTARHHLAHITGAPPLLWYDTTPPPIVDQETAREAIRSALQILLPGSGLDLAIVDGWESALHGDTQEELDAVWSRLGSRKAAEQAVRLHWARAVGREWSDGPQGDAVTVELDSVPLRLALPPLASQTAGQLVHLLVYLQIATLLPVVNHLLETAHLKSIIPATGPVSIPVIAPTPTRPAHPPRISLLQRELWTVFFFASISAFKIIAMVWMLTRGMRWSDVRLWIIGGAAAGWWIGDAAQQIRTEVQRLQRQARREAGITESAAGGDGQAAGAAAAAGDPALPRAAAGAGAAAPQPNPQQPGVAATPNSTTPTIGKTLMWLIPLIQLQHDSRLLHLPLSATYGPLGDLDHHLNGVYPQREAQMRQRASQIPPWYIRCVILPVLLWIITLVPDWEAFRSRAIRKRERAMRVLVGELTTARRAERLAAGETLEVGEAEEEEEKVYPDGLTPQAKQYYERVMQRGEGIDWEEEREAQRAMGIQDEAEERAARAWRW